MSMSDIDDNENDWQWTVDANWFGVCEGPYTVFAKLVIGNGLIQEDLLKGLNARLLKSNPAQLHGRTFLDLSWARPTCPAYADLIAEVTKRTLSQSNPRWWRCLASDNALRYCPQCIAQGFQSVLCQIDGLTLCPVHNVPIVDRCLSCNRKTPRYALTEEILLSPLTCPDCEVAYGAAWSPENHFASWHSMPARAYETLGRELQQVERLSITWPDQGAWLLDPADPRSDAKRRARTFELLTSFVHSTVIQPSERINVRRYAIERSAQPWTLDDIDHRAAVRTTIYKSIRRHFRRRLKCKNSRVHARREDLIWDCPHSVLLPANASVGSELHGFLSWRTRFEADRLWGEISTGRSNELHLRYGVVGWPAKWRSTDAAWANFCLACLKHELMSAEHFRTELGKLDLHSQSDRSDWLELATRLHHRFGPVSRLWPAGITCFAISASGDPSASDLQLVLVSARSGEEGIAECVGQVLTDGGAALVVGH